MTLNLRLVLAALIVCAAGVSIGVGTVTPASAAAGTMGPVPSPAPEARAVLDRYCVTCHNQRLKTGGLTLDTLDLSTLEKHSDVGEAIVRKLRGGMMPPAGAPRPDRETYATLRGWFETELDRIAAASPNPGRTESFHRLNRAEYKNATRDLLLLDVNVADLLPADDGSYGFDNIAGVLKINQALLERYLLAAKKISRLAVGAIPSSPTAETFRIPNDAPQYERADGLPVGTRGGRLIPFYFPVDGEYEFKIELTGGTPPQNEQLDVLIDGERVKELTVTPQTPRSNDRVAGTMAFVFRMPVKAGPRDVGFGFVQTNGAYIEGQRRRFVKPRVYDLTGSMLTTMTYLASVTINGPFDVSGPGDTPSRRRVFVCEPASAADEVPCARRILSTLARRAYRGPVADTDIKELVDFFKSGRANGTFDQGIELALRRLLASPNFLFRMETDPDGVAPNANYRIGNYELASRLSFFLWSSIPDDELLDVAGRGTLRQPQVLERQVKRMLADPRSDAMVSNFLDQWLYIRNVPNVTPADDLFPDFDATLRQAFQRETELFFASIIRDDRSVLDLLTADYTYVNERLAKHYGIPNVTGNGFRRVALSDTHRRGLLGQGSILTVTSRPNRTSPVLRGKWILQNLLGTPPPPPPAVVPPLAEKKDGAAPQSMRERMAQHRANPVCASCHAMIDPAGFALENFDAVGQWRDLDESFKPIDASGALPDGTKFDGVDGLRQALVANPDGFVTTMTEKLLIYALGRGLGPSDGPAVRAIVRGAAAGHYTFSSMILGIVRSAPFQMRRSDVRSESHDY
jgi:mono/diheme cytochrome c family protein